MKNYSNENFTALRKQSSMTQEEFAEILGINRPQVGSYEEHRAKVPVEIIGKLCKMYNIRMEDFVFKQLKLS